MPRSESAQTEDEETEDGETETELTRDDVFHVLQCRRRRLVLKYLQGYDGDGPARIGDIAAHIAAVERQDSVDASQSQQRQRVGAALHNAHLTKMDELGVIEYDQDRGCVRPTPLVERFDDYLDAEPSILGADATDDDAETSDSVDETAELRWDRRYLYAAVGSLLATAVLSSGVLSTPVPRFSLGISVSLLFVLLATTHRLSEFRSTLTQPTPEQTQD